MGASFGVSLLSGIDMNKIYATHQVWRLMIPDGAVGASEDYFDLFNATSGTVNTGGRIVVSSVKVVVVGDVLVTGLVGLNLHLHKTTAVGTTGTAATTQGVSNTAATFSTVTPDAGALPSGITARLKPGGGATIGAWIGQIAVFTEETSAATYYEKYLHTRDQECIVLNQGEGLKVIQGTVASVGSVGFIVEFGLLEQ